MNEKKSLSASRKEKQPGPRWHCGKVSASGLRVPGSKPDSPEDPPRMQAYCSLNHAQWAKQPPDGVVRKIGVGVPSQASSSTSDRGSK
ncbi:hypothetical protein AVEN_219875-1 [Araneus ventricosus]|uniref:Uncharacterized protein n=1 Tax=Araneus ventricosus TaxID=182803 RepID=A0A4Y2SN74_ARAVE|nr:hypothetical protein AVEN_219875-1 [Araneus ventricosus]